MTAFTICLPHRRNPGNDRALAVCLSCLSDNTHNDFKLIIDAAYNEPLYPRVNRMVEQADTDICVYWASDFFAALAWDIPMLDCYEPDTFVTNIVVEPGAIAMSGQNLHADFGRKPETFRRAEFEDWAASEAPPMAGKGWVAPYLFSRQRFLDLGGLSEYTHTDHRGFNDSDIQLFKRHEESGGRIVRARSYVYHLQGYSDIDEQTAEKRN